MKICTRWWQGYKNPLLKYTLAFGLGLLCLFSARSQTFPDFRKVCAQGVGNDITLSWSPITDGCGGFQKLYIYGRVDVTQPFKIIDSIASLAQTTYLHSGAKAVSTTWNYFLVYKFLCNGDSAYSKTLDIDFNQPPVSTIDSVSVDINTGKVLVGWSPNPAPDQMAYVIWNNVGTNNTPIDTLDSTVFFHPASSPGSGPQSYTLTAVDSCWNQSVISGAHRTVFLQHLYDTCNKSITLTWSAYVGWNNILGYDVYVKNGQGAFTLATANNSTALSYTFTNFAHGDTLEFYIKAKDGNNGFTSTSNKISITTRARKFSAKNYLSYATVVDSNAVEIKLLADSNSDVTKYVIYRRKESESFTKLTDLTYDGISPSLTYTDNTAEAYKTSYQYRYISEDVCNKTLDTSNTGKTMFLSLQTNDGGTHLVWNRYGIWNAGVNQYTVYRGYDFGGGFTWNILNTVPNTDSFYYDNVFPTETGIAGTCYYVVADELPGNVFGEQAQSKSNTVCVVEDAIIHFPNAFTPDGVNPLFLPKGVNINYRRTNMRIYARNGQLMKEISDISKGWDGTNLNGDMCPIGVYLYICELYGINEKKYNFKGTLHLLR